jgi:hypothetical protein
MAFCDRQLYYYYYYYYFTPLNRGEGAIIIINFFCDKELMVQQDNDVLPSGFLSAYAAGAKSGGRQEVVEWFC